MSHRIPYTATFPDGSQLLVTRWINDDGSEHSDAARRAKRDDVWGPPVPLELAESEREFR